MVARSNNKASLRHVRARSARKWRSAAAAYVISNNSGIIKNNKSGSVRREWLSINGIGVIIAALAFIIAGVPRKQRSHLKSVISNNNNGA